MSFDLSRLRRGEWIVGAGGTVLLASMLLLQWYAYGAPRSARSVSRTVDGWNALTHFRWLAVVTVAMAAACLLVGATRRAPALPVTLSLFAGALGGLTSAWLLYRVAINPAGGRQAGGWVALAGAIAIAYGGFASMRREGIAPGDAPSVIPTVDPRAQRDS